MMVAELPYPTAILLDWDGTIVDSMARVHQVLSGIGKEMHLPPVTHQQSHDLTIHQKKTGEAVFGLDATRSEQLWKSFSERFFVFDGQLALLDYAENFVVAIPNDIPVGVVSNNRGDLLRAQIDHLGWTQRFGAIVAADEARANKPAPDHALEALRQLGVKPSRDVWLVGDTRGDVECAHAAGLTSILLAGADMPTCQPHYRFSDCRPLQKHLRP